MNPHNIEAISVNHDIPEPIREAIQAWRLFTEWAYTYFEPSRETQARAFLNFAYTKGGLDAVKWLGRKGYISKQIIREFKKEQKNA